MIYPPEADGGMENLIKAARYIRQNGGDTGTHTCGINSVVECHLAKVKVASPNLVSRSKKARKALFLHRSSGRGRTVRHHGKMGVLAGLAGVDIDLHSCYDKVVIQLNTAKRRHSQEVRHGSAKPLFPSSNLGGASKR